MQHAQGGRSMYGRGLCAAGGLSQQPMPGTPNPLTLYIHVGLLFPSNDEIVLDCKPIHTVAASETTRRLSRACDCAMSHKAIECRQAVSYRAISASGVIPFTGAVNIGQRSVG